MPTRSFATGAGSGLSSTTYATLKGDVAAIVGSEADPLGVRADRAITRAIKWLQRIRWFYLGTTIDITLVDSEGLVAGQEGFEGTYTLPARFKAAYSLLTGFNLAAGENPKTWNDYVDHSLFDRLTSDEGRFQARFRARHLYTLWNSKQSGLIKIIDAPSQAGLAELKYFRSIIYPVADDDVMDLLDGPMENAVTARAQYYVLQIANPTARGLRRDLFAESELDMRKARGDDRAQFGQKFELLPPDVHVARGNRLAINATDGYGYGGY